MDRLLLTLALLAALVPACSDSGGPASTTPDPPVPAEPIPDFSLLDRNPNSDTAGQLVSPRDLLGFTSAWYFGSGTWGYCWDQFGLMQQMQEEILADNPDSSIRFLGIGVIGTDGGAIPGDITRPWVQDTNQAGVQLSWSAEFRDIVILDKDNIQVGVFSVEAVNHDLSNPDDYAALKALLLQLAGE